MKKTTLSLLTELALLTGFALSTTAYASLPLTNGSGHILPSPPNGPLNTGNSLPASVSLDNLMPNAVHDIVCYVSIENFESESPVYVRFDINGLQGNGGNISNIQIDGVTLFSSQYRFKDSNKHRLIFSNITTGGAKVSIQMTRLDGWMIPFNYECSAEYVEGLTKK